MIIIKTSRDILMLVIFLVSVTFTTVVYSAFSTQLQIKGEALVRSEQIIRITGLKIKDVVNNAYETYNSKYEKETTSLYVTLPANSSITYEATITNKSENVYKIIEMLELANSNPNVSVSYSIAVDDYISKKNKKDFTITLTNNSEVQEETTLITQYKFEETSWNPLETVFLSESKEGDLAINKDGVYFEFSVTNTNDFNINYFITSSNARFTLTDVNTDSNSFQIGPNETITHKVLVKLREDVTYEDILEELKLIVRSTHPAVDNVTVETVKLRLPTSFKVVVLKSMPITDSPKNFTWIENQNGYLLRTNEIDDISYTYFYRGVVESNYVEFAGKLWRIVRVDSNGNVRVVLNENVETKSPYNSAYISGAVENIEAGTALVDYRNSDVKNNVEAWYNSNIAPHGDNVFVVNSNFCIDTNYQDAIQTIHGNTVYYYTPYLHVGVDTHNFTPDFSCASDNIFTSHVGLLTAEEILAAGGYWQEINDKYYLYNQDVPSDQPQTSWTMSPSYYSENEKQSGVIVYNQYTDVNSKGSLFDWTLGGNLSVEYGYRPVVSLNGNVLVGGDGSKGNPFKLIK